MKQLKYILIISLGVFSFYFSDKAIMYIESKSPIMQTINEVSPSLSVDAKDAKIDGNTIVPGKNGKVVNKRESYLKMNDFGSFNETFFIYDDIKPKISLYDNLDKVIVRGNDDTKVSLIVNNEEFEKYLLNNKIIFSKIIYQEEKLNKDIIYINGNNNVDEFNSLNYYLKRNKLNNKICIVGKSNLSECKKNKYFLVSPSLDFYKNTLAINKRKINGGMILYIHNNLNINECKLILNEIKYNKLEIISIIDIIKE